MKLGTGALAAVLAVTALPDAERGAAETVTPVTKLDYGTLLGGWREIARLPNRREKKCDHDAQLLLADGNKPGQIQMVESCTEKSEIRDWWGGTLKREKKAANDGQLRLVYFFLLPHKTYVLAMGAKQEWALVGSPNHKELWIFARTPELAPAVLSDVKQTAVAQGFKLDRLVMVPQSRLPQAAKPAESVTKTEKTDK